MLELFIYVLDRLPTLTSYIWWLGISLLILCLLKHCYNLLVDFWHVDEDCSKVHYKFKCRLQMWIGIILLSVSCLLPSTMAFIAIGIVHTAKATEIPQHIINKIHTYLAPSKGE